jgi:hypothetical protein
MNPLKIPYTGVVAVSPAVFVDEEKNQDRARFFGPGQVACLCDGVTTSPHAEKAAGLVTSVAPVLFQGNTRERMRMVSDLLMSERSLFQATHPTLAKNMPEGMQAMVIQALRQNQANSFQTTMVALRVRADTTKVAVDLLRCGDSAFFAFSGDGELLKSSLSQPSECQNDHHLLSHSHQRMFGPGRQILVRVEGPLNNHEDLAQNSGIDGKYLRNWLVCTPIDVGPDSEKNQPVQIQGLVITAETRLLVPRYLHGHQLESEGREYRCLDYSSTIRILPSSPPTVPADSVEHRGSATAVLPDHIYGGHFESAEDRFPADTQLVLSSDGFYGAFATASELWVWLQANKDALQTGREQSSLFNGLHERLRERSGDDDMSLVWMYPNPPAYEEASSQHE